MRVSFNNTIEKVTFFDDNNITCIEYRPLSDYVSVLRNKKRRKMKNRHKKYISNCIQTIYLYYNLNLNIIDRIYK